VNEERDRQSAALWRVSPPRAALFVALVCAVTLAGAFMFQAAGYQPCELCLKERIPYYLGLPLAGLAFWSLRAGAGRLLALAFFAALGLLFAFSAAFGAYHAGVEWGFFPGPSECTGAYKPAAEIGDFLKQLETTQVVRCDAVAVRILGLSLAGWNAVISAALAWLCLVVIRPLYGSSSVSQ
jgi:disulfide bond formation protein DsbB